MKKQTTLITLLTLIAASTPAQAQSVTEPPPVPLIAQVRAAHEPASRFRLTLDADVGYGAYLTVFEDSDRAHGVVANVGLSLTWGNDRRRYGLRFNGMYAPRMSSESMSSDADHRVRVGSIHAGFLADFGGLWLSPSAGLAVVTHMNRSSNGGNAFESEEAKNLPEFNFAFGYNVPLGRSLDLTLRADAGTIFFVVWRFSGSAGLRLKF